MSDDPMVREITTLDGSVAVSADDAATAVFRYGRQQYELGYEAGLEVAERIVVEALSRQPDTKLAALTRKWVQAALAVARSARVPEPWASAGWGRAP